MQAYLLLALCIYATAVFGQDDYCGHFPTCATCIENTPCGWCAINITYSDGSSGPHCAGKPADPAHPPPNYKPWTCMKDYQNTACYGYVCNSAYQCVSSGTPGGGVPLHECMAKCIPPTYECNSTTYQCYQVQPGHGTDKPDCERQCKAPAPQSAPQPQAKPGPEGPPSPQPAKYECVDYQCVPTKTGGGVPLAECTQLCAHNITPVFVIGDWRGLEISQGFVRGEWQMKVTEQSAIIVDPNGAAYVKGQIVSKGNELWLESDVGTRRGIFGINELPEVTVLTWGLGTYGGAPPANFDAALQSGTTWVWAKCLSAEHCHFHIFNSLVKALPASLAKQLNENQIFAQEKRDVLQNDPCSVYPDCHTCITAPESCGWCSVPVIYNNVTIGKNCAGTNSSISGRINCTGTFSTEDCTFSTTGSTTSSTSTSSTGTTGGPTNKYICDPATETCKMSENGTQPLDVCNAQCKSNPFVPPNIQNKYWRGLEIDTTYVQGEWRAYFGTTNVTILDPSGKITEGTVSTVEEYLVVKTTSGHTLTTLWQSQPGPASTFLTWAWGALDQGAPQSFGTAMYYAGEREFFFVACQDGKPASVCNFSN